MFSRIYSGILLSLVLIAAFNLMLYHWSWQERRAAYEQAALEGVMHLIASDLQRQPQRNRILYLDIVARLLGAEVKIAQQAQWLTEQGLDQSFVFDPQDKVINLTAERGRISWLLLPDKESLVEVNIGQLAEQQFRAHALLLVAELSRNQPASLAELRQNSAFPLNVAAMEGLPLDAQQLSRLKRGGVVVGYKAETQAAVAGSFSVYARLSEGKALVLGPVPQPEPLPLWLVLVMLGLSSLIIIGVSYWLVFQLEQRLKKVSVMVRAFGKGELQARVGLAGKDSIAELGQHVDAMASRIENLLQGQREIMQAVSHELRTPLARIQFRLELLEEGDDGQAHDPAVATKTEVIRKDLRELEQLVDEVLEHHKLMQVPDLKLVPLEAWRITQQVIERLQPLYPQLSIETGSLENQSTPDKPAPLWVAADEASLGRLLSNLASNALKHAHSHIRVNWGYDHQGVLMQVHDDGAGIAPQERGKVFEPFYQIDVSRNKKKGGYGLGLAIVKRIVDLHGGQIQISSSPLGGACFSVCLPKPPPAPSTSKA